MTGIRMTGLLAIFVLASTAIAHAQTRTYSCAKGSAIALTVIAPNAIKADRSRVAPCG